MDTQNNRSNHFRKIAGLLGLFLVLTGLYWYGAVQQLTLVNTDMTATDQSAYMEYARTMVESSYTVVGGRNRMPVYPFLQSLFYRPGMSDAAFFTVGKYVNLVLSLFLLAGLAGIFRWYLPWLAALTLLLITAFTVFIFKAGFFQTELLFYFLNFCLFLLMIHLLQRNAWPLAILTGIVAGIAHLTKASILPGLALFLAVAGLRWGWVALQSRDSVQGGLPKRLLSNLLPVALVGICFLITVYPYISTSKRVFGHYFYNVNSTFYMWYDSWEEAKQGTRAHGDRVGWPTMPLEEIPSLRKYLREHTSEQIVNRVVGGGQTVLNNVVNSYGYFKYIILYFILLVAAMFWSWRQVVQALRTNPLLYLFLVTYFVLYFLLCFWYAPIASGNRIILAQFLPLLFSLAYGFHGLLRSSTIKAGKYCITPSAVATVVILLIVVVDIYFVLTERVGIIYGGL
jgi:hypothetical protein